MTGRMTLLALCAVALAVPCLSATPVLADPPSWAPAHGYRAKQKVKSAKKFSRNDEAAGLLLPRISLSECNRDLIGGALGGALGGLLGSRFGKGAGRLAATATGTIIGVLVGGSIGRVMDQVDQSCVGNVLESARTGQTVAWHNPNTDSRYEVTPVETLTNYENRYCREYTAKATVGGRSETVQGAACRHPDGSWRMVN